MIKKFSESKIMRKDFKLDYLTNFIPLFLMCPIVCFAAYHSTGIFSMALWAQAVLLFSMAFKCSLSLFGVGGILSYKKFKTQMQKIQQQDYKPMRILENKEKAQFMFLDGNHKK